MQRKKVILISNTSWYLYNFKFKLIKSLIAKGYKVIIIAPFDKYTKLFGKQIDFINWNINLSYFEPSY